MNFEQTRELKRKKRRKICWILLGIATVFAILIGIFCKFYPADSWKYYVKLPKVSARKAGELRVHFLDVGQGDCAIIEFPDGKSMIVDGGDGSEETTKKVLRYVNALKIKKFDFMVLTHPHADHVGALDTVLKYIGAKTVYCPKINDYDINPDYADFRIELAKSSAKMIYTEVGAHYIGTGEYPYRFAFLSPHKIGNPACQYDVVNDGVYTDEEMNDVSAVLLLEYQEKRILFCGDAGISVEESLMTADKVGSWKSGELYDFHLQADILKVSHHGAEDATSEKFLSYLNVKTAVISCGKENVYGHPHHQLLERLQNAKVEVFRTDKHGTVVATVDKEGEITIR